MKIRVDRIYDVFVPIDFGRFLLVHRGFGVGVNRGIFAGSMRLRHRQERQRPQPRQQVNNNNNNNNSNNNNNRNNDNNVLATIKNINDHSLE